MSAEKPKDVEVRKNPNIYQRISAIQSEVTKVDKDAQVKAGDGQYAAVTHDSVTKMLRPLMVKHGVVSVINPQSLEVVPTGVMWGKRELMQIRAYFSVTYRNIDNPEDAITVWVHAYADDNGDKGPGKVMSYAQKYADLKLFRIQTGDDDEQRVDESKLKAKTDPLTEDEVLEVWNKAEELFGDNADKELAALVNKIFPYAEGKYTALDRKHKDAAINWLQNKADAVAEAKAKRGKKS